MRQLPAWQEHVALPSNKQSSWPRQFWCNVYNLILLLKVIFCFMYRVTIPFRKLRLTRSKEIHQPFLSLHIARTFRFRS